MLPQSLGSELPPRICSSVIVNRSSLPTEVPGRILIIGPHPLLCAALSALVRQQLRCAAVECVHTLPDACKALLRFSDFDLAVLDPEVSTLSVEDIITTLRAIEQSVSVLVYSNNDDAAFVQRCLLGRASGFVSKGSDAAEICRVMNRLRIGRSSWPDGRSDRSPALGGKVLRARVSSRVNTASTLTGRQQQVLILLCHGHSNKAIGRELAISESAVKGHLQKIFQVLQVSTRAAAIVAARDVLDLHPLEPIADQTMRIRRLPAYAGFTLIELLVVVAIIALLASYVGPRLFGQIGKSERETARAQIDAFSKALDTYRIDTGRYPPAELGLSALLKQPPNEARWRGPYLQKSVPLDPWGNAYQYANPGRHGDYDLVSLGKDGRTGGTGDAADINSWE